MGREKIDKIADSLRNMSEGFGVYELGVFHLQPETESSEPYLLVGVDTSNKEAVSVYEDWLDKWSSSLRMKNEEEVEEIPNTVVREFRVK